MTEKQEPYVTATATPDLLRGTEVVVLTHTEHEVIERWRKDKSKAPIFVEPRMSRLWDQLCRAYAATRKGDIPPILVIDMNSLEPYSLSDFG